MSIYVVNMTTHDMTKTLILYLICEHVSHVKMACRYESVVIPLIKLYDSITKHIMCIPLMHA